MIWLPLRQRDKTQNTCKQTMGEVNLPLQAFEMPRKTSEERYSVKPAIAS